MKNKNSNCKGCGMNLHVHDEFDGLPCNEYCCLCCPSREKSPCPKEEKFGTVAEIWSRPREPLDDDHFKKIVQKMRGG